MDTQDYLQDQLSIPILIPPNRISAMPLNRESAINFEDSLNSRSLAKSIRRREFKNCFSSIDDEMQLEALHDKKVSSRTDSLTSSVNSKGFKKRMLNPSNIFKKTSNASTALYDLENQLLEMEQTLLDNDDKFEIDTLKRHISSDNQHRTLWSRDSIIDPFYRSSLPEVEKMFLEAALDDNPDTIIATLGKTGIYKKFIECTDELGRTALHLAATCGNAKVVETLLKNGAQIEVWDSLNTATPLMCAASCGSEEALRVLLKWNADVNTGYESGMTALYWACSEGHYNCAKALLENGAKQSATTIFSETPLHVTALTGDTKLMKLLLDNGADVNLLSGVERNTALHVAAQEYDLESCKLLVKAGSSTHVRNARGLTPLHFASFENPILTNFLLSSGSDPNIVDNEGRSPLFYAVGKGKEHEECLELLLKYDAKVNLQDQLLYTPLHIAAIKEASKSASILLRYGADLTLKNASRQTGLALFTRRIPDAMNIFKDYLNDCVIMTNINHKVNVKLDFTPLVPNQLSKPLRTRRERKTKARTKSEGVVPIETDLLRCFLETGQEEILLHPLVEAFLQLKWQRLRKFFVFSFIVQMILVLTYSSFILEVYKVDCPFSKMSMLNNGLQQSTQTTPLPSTTPIPTSEDSMEFANNSLEVKNLTMESIKVPASNPPTCRIDDYYTWGFVVVLAVLTVLKELIQFVQCPGGYFKSVEKWALLLFLVSLSLSVLPPRTIMMGDRPYLLSFQYPIAAVGVCLAWGLMFIHIGNFPSVGLYVQMLVKVGSNFMTFLVVYGFIMIAFAMSLSLLFPEVKTFGSFFEIILKLIRIMTGDVNLEYLIYDDPITRSKMPNILMANIIHTICVVILSIVLMNLLVGLAVNDIQGLYRTAKLKKLARQAELIAYLESFILSKRLLYFLNPTLRTFLLNSVTVAPSYYKCFFYFHPNDKDDKRLPEDLKTALVRLKDHCSSESINADKGYSNNFKKLQEQISGLEAKIEQLILKVGN